MGTCRNFFTCRGFRQGDPLSSLLVLVMEPLNRLIAKVKEGGFIRGFKFKGRGEEGVYFSHLSYANDTLLF